MYLFLLTSLLAIFIVWFITFSKRKESTFAKLVHTTTGAKMPGINYFQSVYHLLVLRRKIGVARRSLYLSEKYGKIYHSMEGIGLEPNVTVTDPNLVKEALKKINEIPKAPIPDGFASTMFGYRNLVRLNNPEWHEHRSILNKSFISNKVFFEPIEKKVLQCVERWKKSEPVSVSQDLQKMTLDVLATCIFGNDFDTLNGNNSGPLASYNYCLGQLNNPLNFLIPFYGKLPLPANIRWRKEMEIFDAYCWSIIAQAKKSMEDNDSTKENNIKSLIALMIEGGMTEKDIRNNVATFFIAGNDTTAKTLMWTVGLIAKYPEVQEKARKEVLENTKNGLTYETLKDLNYIDWIIHETLRIYPSLSATDITNRVTKTEMIIGNYYIPAKTIIQADFISMLQSKEIWGDPENFRPERFDPDILTKEQRSSWMPFSYGPRICIGINFTLTEQKIFLATLLREFSFIKLSENSVLEIDEREVVTKPKHYQVQFYGKKQFVHLE